MGAAFAGMGGVFLLTQLARDAGKRREPSLFQLWGGMPSIVIFRHANKQLDAITKTRYHKKLEGLVAEAKAPTREEELANLGTADEVYSAWSQFLRTNTRDIKKYSMLFNENVNYGYRRNVWGLRPIGIALSLLCVLALGGRLWLVQRETGQINQDMAIAFGVALLFLVLWLFRLTSDWVRVPAIAYAERLAESVETMDFKTTGKKPKA